MSDNKIELKIVSDYDNSEVQFASMSAKAAVAFSSLVKSITEIVHTVNPETRITLFSGSLGVRIESEISTQDSIESTLNSLLERNFNGGDEIEHYRSLQNLFQANGLSYSFKFHKEGSVREFSTRIKQAKKFTKKKTIIISDEYNIKFAKGKLIEVGGKNPNMHIEPGGGSITPLKISCAEGSARKAIPFLYNVIHVSYWERMVNGVVRELDFCDVYKNEDDYNLFKGYWDEICSLRGDTLERLSRIYDITRSLIEGKGNNDFGYLVKYMRLFRHPSADVNDINTILMLTAPIRRHSDAVARNWGFLKEFMDENLR